MEPAGGIEPPTYVLRVRYSTTESRWLLFHYCTIAVPETHFKTQLASQSTVYTGYKLAQTAVVYTLRERCSTI